MSRPSNAHGLQRRHRFKALKKVGKGFLAALRVVDHQALTSQSGQGEAHGHTVIVVGFNLSWARLRRRQYPQPRGPTGS